MDLPIKLLKYALNIIINRNLDNEMGKGMGRKLREIKNRKGRRGMLNEVYFEKVDE